MCRFEINFVNIFIFIPVVSISDKHKNEIETHKISFEYL